MGVLINGDLIFQASSANWLQATSTHFNTAGVAGVAEGVDGLTGITYRPSGFQFGVVSGVDDRDGDGTGDFTGYFTSRNFIHTLDLVSEGEIEGPVSGDYVPVGVVGETGYQTEGFSPWVVKDVPDTWLRSVSFNDVPVLNEVGQLNFQQVGVSIFDGTPSGLQTGDAFLTNLEESKPSRTRTINERLYGPDVPGGVAQYYPKDYRIFNHDVSKIVINIKISALSYTKFGNEFEEEEIGQTVGSRLNFGLMYRAIYGFDLGGGNSEYGNWIELTNSDMAFNNLTVEGKLDSEYLHEIPITLDQAQSNSNLKGWEVRITRKTVDSIKSTIKNQTFVDTITEIYEHGFSYPNSAVVASLFRSDYFSQIPNRSFDMKLMKVKVPTGYDPTTRSYSKTNGVHIAWDGTFQEKRQWTDNPAWVFYDLISNKRYGLGKYIKEIDIDKWTLYKIGQYCDVLVDDGSDGYEPRFSCNVLINTREEAYKVLQDFASIFRGIIYYGLGNVHAVQDSPKDPLYQFINGNVSDGNFHYASTSRKVRPSVAVVRYNDKWNYYKPAVEIVEDVDAIRRYGIRERELTAFGCTSKAQAIRLGRWLLYTENWETDIVTFSCGPEGLLLRPGDLIQVADKYKGLGNEGGRAVSISETGVWFDRKYDFGSSSYKLTVNTPTYFYDTSLVSGTTSDKFTSSDIPNIRRSHLQNFTFSTSNGASTTNGVDIYDTIIGTGANGPITGSVIKLAAGKMDAINYNVTGDVNVSAPCQPSWAIQDVGPSGYEPEYYSVTNIKEDANYNFDVTATKFHTGKFLAIESGITFAPTEPSVPSSNPPPPDPVSIAGSTSFIVDSNGTQSTNTKQIDFEVTTPSALGSTLYYQVWAKTGSAFGVDDFKENTSTPRDEFRLSKLSAVSNAANKLEGSFIPFHNSVDYHLLTYAINSVGIHSSNYKENVSPISVSDHFPIRDIQIDSLRLKVNQTEEGSAGANLKPSFVVDPNDKDHHFTWRAINKFTNAPSIPLQFRVTVRPPSANSTPNQDVRLSRYIGENEFSHYFDLNRLHTQGGPLRHYDLVVEAIDPNIDISKFPYPLNSSTGVGLAKGYDILEVHDQRPSGYNLTPRVSNATRPGSCFGSDAICTEQYLTSDGRIFVRLRNNSYTDLKGGNIYLSASGFNTGDFIGGRHGYPNNPGRTGTVTDPYEAQKRQILTIPFEAPENGILQNPIIATPTDDDGMPFVFDYTTKYYMAMSFHDSFDLARKKAGDLSYNNDQYVAFARPATGEASVVIPGCDTTGYPAPELEGDDAVCVYPSRYFAANAENPFKYWIRLNVNGQWEGQGISMVRVLTAADVENYYDYDGFYDYTCRMVERYSPTQAGQQAVWPNDYLFSRSVCRFTQGREYTANGVTVVVDYHHADVNTANDIIRGLETGTPAPKGSLENVISYNEKGERAINVIGTELTRPLHGYRRFRVYFDPNNLPASGESQRLAPYSVLGFNAWNGVYESWPGSQSEVAADPSLLTNSIFFGREMAAGSGMIFPEHTVQTWMGSGDYFENIPGVWNHHPAGFGQGFGGLIKTQKYFDVHMGRMIDDGYLNEALFAVVTTNDYSIKQQSATFSQFASGSEGGTVAYLDQSMFTSSAYVYNIDDRGLAATGEDYNYS